MQTDVDSWRREWGGDLYYVNGSEHYKGEIILVQKNWLAIILKP